MNLNAHRLFLILSFVAEGNKDKNKPRKLQALAFAFAKADGILLRSINITSDENQVTRAPSTALRQ